MTSGKGHITEGIELPNQEQIEMLGKKGSLHILGNIGSWQHQKVEMKEKILKWVSLENQKATRNRSMQ